MTAVLREADTRDADAIFCCHRDSVLALCAPAYSPLHMAVWFDGRTPQIHQSTIAARQLWVAEQGGAIQGFVGFVPGEVTLLFVRAQAVGQGLGRKLLALGIQKAEQGFSGALTVVSTLNAQAFYEAHGFVAVEAQTFVRGAPELHFDVVRMERPARSLQPSEALRSPTVR